MHGLLHRHPCRKEFKKMEMPVVATPRREPSTERQDPGWSPCLPGKKGKPNEGQQAGSAGSTRKGPAHFLRAVVSVGKDLGL